MDEFLKNYQKVDPIEPISYPDHTCKVCAKNKNESFTESHAYKYLGSFDNNEIILYSHQGEGPENSSFLYALNLKRDDLKILETIAKGDRA